jgi:Ser/Thr protein kinase RdoA (MazF antagonist)
MKLPRFEDFERDFKSDVWHKAAKFIAEKHKLPFKSLRRASQGESITFLVDEKFVIKIYSPLRNGFKREKLALSIAETSLKIPEIVAAGGIENYQYLITTLLTGELMTKENWLKLDESEQISILAQLARGLRELHRSDNSTIDFDWEKFIEKQAKTCLERQKACQVNEKVLEEIPAYLENNLRLLPTGIEPLFLHGDVHFGNLRLLNSNGKWQISGLFDFADSLKGFYEYDFLAVGILMIQGQGHLQREFFRAYGYAESDLTENLRKRLMLLTMFYECSDLRRYAIRLRPEAVDYSLLELERAIWNFC